MLLLKRGDNLNYPILLKSTHNLTSLQIKKYVEVFNRHNATFSQLNKYQLFSHHRYIDQLSIMLTWNIVKPLEKFPETKTHLEGLENEGFINFHRGEIVKFSSESKIKEPSNHCFQVFHNEVKSKKRPLDKRTLKYLENTTNERVKSETEINLETFFDEIEKYNLFYDYLKTRNK